MVGFIYLTECIFNLTVEISESGWVVFDPVKR